MKKIAISLGIIGVVAAAVIGGTIAYFSDTETSIGNTFTAGTIDISIDNENPWTKTFTMEDMKPCYTDYINFRIDNNRSDPNPVNIFKKIIVTSEGTGTVSEPECTEQNGKWISGQCDWTNATDNNNLSAAIWYDLYVEVYNASQQKIWWQTIYVDGDNKSIVDVYGGDKSVYLGMIPAGGYMLVKQSYHLAPTTGNWAQGDIMTFSIEVKGEQLYGTVVLENKSGDPDWQILHETPEFQGTLTYKVKNPTFDFSFTGKAPLPSKSYVLAAGWATSGAGFDVDTQLGTGATNSSGDITITGNVELGKDMKNVKVWLVPAENWTGTAMNWTGWPSMVPNFLWETGLIWYDDTDI